MLKDVLLKWGGKAVEPIEVYRDIFRLGEGYIQSYGKQSRNIQANPLGYYRYNGRQKGHYRIFFEDTFEETLKELQQADFAIVNGISYFGRKNVQEHASKMYCMIFDLDGVTDEKLSNFLSGAFAKDWDIYPLPNYIILSGHGVHLYYIFEEPIPLYPNLKIQLKELKYALTGKMWNGYTSTILKPQYQGINQGFRVIGGKTKIEGVITQAYLFNTHPYTLKQLGQYVEEAHRVDESKLYRESKMTLEQAKEKYPKWYNDVVLNRNKSRKKWDIAGKTNGNNPYALYDWWKRRIEIGSTYHHRYFAIMALAIYGVKDGVPKEQVEKDAHNFISFMNLIDEHPFTESDVQSALECYDERYCTFPISDIEKLTAINIPRNKRNGRKQAEHVKIMNAIKKIKKEAGERVKEGRPKGTGTKQSIIENWQTLHPTGTISECARETKTSRTTVYKYWQRQPADK